MGLSVLDPAMARKKELTERRRDDNEDGIKSDIMVTHSRHDLTMIRNDIRKMTFIPRCSGWQFENHGFTTSCRLEDFCVSALSAFKMSVPLGTHGTSTIGLEQNHCSKANSADCGGQQDVLDEREDLSR